jgi:hypothetical protein
MIKPRARCRSASRCSDSQLWPCFGALKIEPNAEASVSNKTIFLISLVEGRRKTRHEKDAKIASQNTRTSICRMYCCQRQCREDQLGGTVEVHVRITLHFSILRRGFGTSARRQHCRSAVIVSACRRAIGVWVIINPLQDLAAWQRADACAVNGVRAAIPLEDDQ